MRKGSRPGEKAGWYQRLRRALLGIPGDREELVTVLRGARERELIDGEALAMIEGVLHVSEMQVRDVMIPRAQIVAVGRDDPLETILEAVIESAHSRFPVLGDDRARVVGIVLAKDLLGFSAAGNERFDMRQILRPAVFVPEAKRLNVLLKEFRANRNHMAIVVDEFGAASGLVTIEDVLEQIVGDIEDEYDFDEDTDILKLDSTLFTVKAATPLEDFNDYFDAAFDANEVDTIGGLVVKQLGHVPKRGEQITVDRFRIEVLRADARRIHLLRIEAPPPLEDAGPGDSA
ncbi:MAG: CBS domain-containing protein [Chromatiales bacterium]|nr:CBS domain-containing protein [Chromatiales bacterium]